MKSINEIKYIKKDYIIDEIMRTNGLYCLIAYPKVGKSMLALQISDCIANNKPFLECNTNHSPILYISTESSGNQLLERINMMNIKFKDNDFQYIDRNEYSNFFLKDLEVDISDFARNQDGKLVIVDMLKDIEFDTEYDINSYQDVGQYVLPKLRYLCNVYNISILFLHHLNKKGKSLGSTALDGSVDGILKLEQSENNSKYYKLNITNRDYESKEFHLKKDDNCILNITNELNESTMPEALIFLVNYCSKHKDITITATELANKYNKPILPSVYGTLIHKYIKELEKEGLKIEYHKKSNERLYHFLYEEPNIEFEDIMS